MTFSLKIGILTEAKVDEILNFACVELGKFDAVLA